MPPRQSPSTPSLVGACVHSFKLCHTQKKRGAKACWCLPSSLNAGVAVGGAGWYLSRLARGPDVVWDRVSVAAYYLLSFVMCRELTLFIVFTAEQKGNPEPCTETELLGGDERGPRRERGDERETDVTLRTITRERGSAGNKHKGALLACVPFFMAVLLAVSHFLATARS